MTPPARPVGYHCPGCELEWRAPKGEPTGCWSCGGVGVQGRATLGTTDPRRPGPALVTLTVRCSPTVLHRVPTGAVNPDVDEVLCVRCGRLSPVISAGVA